MLLLLFQDRIRGTLDMQVTPTLLEVNLFILSVAWLPSQQISARHHEYSRLGNLSNVASLFSYCDMVGATAAGTGSPTSGHSSGGCITTGGTSTGARAGGGIAMENSPISSRSSHCWCCRRTKSFMFYLIWALSTVLVVMGSAISEYFF